MRTEIPNLLADSPPDAIICSSDRLALLVHQAAVQAGLRPGAAIAITGFDALPMSVELDPQLTPWE